MSVSTRLTNITEKQYRRMFWIFLAAVSVARLWLIGQCGLGVDESHYVMYSRHLAWGYFDHPPMVAFLAALTTALGDGLFFIRLGPVICSTLTLILLRYLALALYREERVAFWAVVLLHLMPYQQVLMLGLLPDATLNVFWCATLLIVWYALNADRWWPWMLAGLFFGAGLLSKYHAVLLPACLFGYLLHSPKYRFWLKKGAPYVGLSTGLLVFLPNILWNAHHGWVSYKYQFGRGAENDWDPEHIIQAVGGQFGGWSPIIFGLLIAACVVLLRKKDLDEGERFALWTSAPVFLIFCLMGITSKILPHWTAVGWWTGSLMLTAVVLKKVAEAPPTGSRWRRWSLAAAIVGLLMSSVVYIGIFVPFAGPAYSAARSVSLSLHERFPAVKPLGPFKAEYDFSADIFGWDQIAGQVEAIRAGMPHPEKTFIFCHRFYMTSLLAVYLPSETVATTIGHKYDQYRLWFSPEDLKGWDALFLAEAGRAQERSQYYRPLFTAFDPQPAQIHISRNGWPVHDLRVYRCTGFKGKFE